MEHSPLKLALRIDWSELDLFGHVNNVAYFKYMQAARVNYWEAVGIYQLYEESKIGPILVSAGCQFRRPLFYPGHITLETRMDFIRNTSFGFQHRMLDEEGRLAAEANDVMVIFDFNTNEKLPFPAAVREAVEKLEGKRF